MSLSPHIKRQTRVVRRILPSTNIRATEAQMDTIQALEPMQSEANSFQTNLTNTTSIKAKRRQGVSDLHIAPLSSFSLGTDLDWRFAHQCESDSAGDDEEVFEFPRPPTSALEARALCSRYAHSPHSSIDSTISGCSHVDSGCSSPASSGPPATPTTPTYPGQTQKRGVVHCKSIKPLTIAKRARRGSPSFSLPPSPSAAPKSPTSLASASSTPPPSSRSTPLFAAGPSSSAHASVEKGGEVDPADDEYYAAHAGAFVTLALPPPLPAAYPLVRGSSASLAPAPSPACLTTLAPAAPSLTRPDSGILASSPSLAATGMVDTTMRTAYLDRVPMRPTRAPPPPPPFVASPYSSFPAVSTASSSFNPAPGSHSRTGSGSSSSRLGSSSNSPSTSASASAFHSRNSHLHSSPHSSPHSRSHSRSTSNASILNSSSSHSRSASTASYSLPSTSSSLNSSLSRGASTRGASPRQGSPLHPPSFTPASPAPNTASFADAAACPRPHPRRQVGAQVPNFSRPTSFALRTAPSIILPARPPSRARRSGSSADLTECDFAADYAAYAPLLRTPTPSPVASAWHLGSAASTSRSASEEASSADIGNPTVSRDSDGDEDVSLGVVVGEDAEEEEWEHRLFDPEGGEDEEDAPLSPLVAPAPSPFPLSDYSDDEYDDHGERWHPLPSDTSTSSCASSVPGPSSSTSSCTPLLPTSSHPPPSARQHAHPPAHHLGDHQAAPVLRSRWSSSTLSTRSSSHDREKTFAFAWRGRGKVTKSSAAASAARKDRARSAS